MSKQTITDLVLHRLLQPEEAASILGVSIGTLTVWRSTGRYGLPYVKSGSRVMYRTEDLHEFIKQRTVNSKVDESL